jgi:hypothetical protein
MEEIDRTAPRNPYSPPKATVADVIPSETREPRPAAVSWAAALLWLDLALSVGDLFLNWWWPANFLGRIGRVVTCILFTLNAWVIYRISTGRNWARWIGLVSVIFRISISIPTVGRILAASTDELDMVSNGLIAVALFLLFASPGRRWFRSHA